MPPKIQRVLRLAGFAALGLVLFVLIVWEAGFLYFSGLPAFLAAPLALAFAIGCPVVLFAVKPRKRALAIVLGAIAAVLVAWFSKRPSNDRDWLPDQKRTAYATFNGDEVTVHNIRNCDYRTTTDYTVRYYDKTFNLSQLRHIDVYVVNWGIQYVSHTMVSFGFPGDQYLCISIETRKEKGESYSTLRGFFRQYEIIYVVGDERDLVRLRTNFRQGENTYLYRIQNMPDRVKREIFLDYFRTINYLHEHPQWYNALTDNCTTSIRAHTKVNPARVLWDWRLLLNGDIDEMMYEYGMLDRSLPFPELKARSLINAKAQAADNAPDFSRRIREGLPGMSSDAGPRPQGGKTP